MLTWESIKAMAAAEKQPRESLEQQIARTGGNTDLVMRLARACVRDGKFTEALAHYDHAELLGDPDAHTERRIVALHQDE
jgi:thioredoxin-like negative regulator of GroEL